MRPTISFRKAIIIVTVILFLGMLVFASWYYGRLYLYYKAMQSSDPQLSSVSFGEFLKQQREQQKFIQQVEANRKAEANDTIGGKTPEETLNLFIDALKKKDIDGASIYITWSKRQQLATTLKNAEAKNNLEIILNDFLNKGPTWQKTGTIAFASFENSKDTRQPPFIFSLVKNISGVWKITDI